MTFIQFIKQLSEEQVNTWWNTIAPNQVEEINWKYKLFKNGKALPFKWAIAELAKYYQINFTNKDFDSNVSSRDAFCEAFDFEIQEDLVYDNTEVHSFITFHKNIKQTYNTYMVLPGKSSKQPRHLLQCQWPSRRPYRRPSQG